MFVELHAQSAFSFLEAAEQPEALVSEAARLGMGALALVDRDGLYGAPRFHQAATAAGLTPIIGTELTPAARAARVGLVATNQPLYARPGGRAVADVFTCLREKTDLDHAGRRLSGNAERGLRGPVAMARAFADLPDALATTGELALRLQFTLKDLGSRFPDSPLPPGQSALEHLRELTGHG